jgi:outer membrane protein OmpA-like peptidoglycan-associated protein
MNKLFLRSAAAVACSLCVGALAAPPVPVLKASEVTEARLVDALAVDAPPEPEGAKTRGFRMSAPQAAPKATGPGKANLMITFETGSAALTAEGARMMDTVARAIQADRLAGLSFRIEGHADPRGTPEMNQRLSEQRARAVVEYLVAKHGILAERLVPVGKGAAELYDPQHPIAPENRRVSIVTER